MGQLEIISTLCEVTTQLSDLVRQMEIELEQAQIAESAMLDIKSQREECQKKLDIVEYRLRRYQNG